MFYSPCEERGHSFKEEVKVGTVNRVVVMVTLHVNYTIILLQLSLCVCAHEGRVCLAESECSVQ